MRSKPSIKRRLVSIFALVFSPVLLYCQTPSDSLKRLEEIRVLLSNKKVSVESVLTSALYMDLHAYGSFREIIKQYAPPDSLNIISKNEPGTPITVVADILDHVNRPLKNHLVYFYHTDQRGWYGYEKTHVNGTEGDRRHGRLFGYLRTDKNGRVVIQTIKPQGYPGSELPSHIHFEVPLENGTALITELLFDDDSRLNPSMRQRLTGEGAYISNAVPGINGRIMYQYTMNTR